MSISKRAQELAQVGHAQAHLIDSIAAMIDAALPRRGRPPKHADDPAKCALTPQAVFDALEAKCSDWIQLRPYTRNSMGRFAKVLGGIAGLEATDLDRVTSWIDAGGLQWFRDKGVPITWSYVVREFPNWVAKARAEVASQPTLVRTDWR